MPLVIDPTQELVEIALFLGFLQPLDIFAFVVFKQKWAQRIVSENGPDDATWSWAKIDMVKLDDVPMKLETLP